MLQAMTAVWFTAVKAMDALEDGKLGIILIYSAVHFIRFGIL